LYVSICKTLLEFVELIQLVPFSISSKRFLHRKGGIQLKTHEVSKLNCRHKGKAVGIPCIVSEEEVHKHILQVGLLVDTNHR